MDLPVMPPVRPMLAKSVKDVPDPASHPAGLSFEPKWDGFRCLVFKDGDEVELTSRNTKPLTRYFPDVVAAAREQLPARCVLDGELYVATPAGSEGDGDAGAGSPPRLQFELLQERIHPAASRVAMLSEEVPAGFVAFDLLALGDESFVDRPFAERRAALEEALAHLVGRADTDTGLTGCHLVRTTTDADEARAWFEQFEGAGLDGVIAKPLDAPYTENGRTMFKIKHARTADVVLAGYREHKTSTPEEPLLGSLLLGLHDGEGNLQHIGVAASFTAARRAELIAELAPLVCEIGEHPWGAWEEWAVANPDRVPGTQSRWSAGKDLSFVPLRPERVLEVGYDHMEGRRFRHTAQFKRWRPDRDPGSCGYDQLDEPVSYDLTTVLTPRTIPHTPTGPDAPQETP
ncbi:MAG TPA: ATP-dependent DNA ligase [Nocardioides sp.]